MMRACRTSPSSLSPPSGRAGPELELLVRRAVDAELQRLTVELVEQELTRRRNGHTDGSDAAAIAPTEQDPAAGVDARVTVRSGGYASVERVCVECGELRRIEKGRHRCGRCRKARRAPPAEGGGEEPAPAATSRPRGGRDALRRAADADADRERRVQLIAAARRNGVTVEQRDGRAFTVVHLPAAQLERGRDQPAPPVRPHLDARPGGHA